MDTMTEQHRTPTQDLASLLLGQDVMAWISKRRASSTLAEIRDDLAAQTEGRVRPSVRTLTYWLAADQSAA